MAKCKYCGEKISWREVKPGKWVPFNSNDWTLHLPNCSITPDLEDYHSNRDSTPIEYDNDKS